MRHIIPISGKDSLATAIVQTTMQPNLPYEFVFNPTGAELPEVFEWIDKVEKYLQKPIIRVGRDLDDIIKSYNYFLPSAMSRYCTRESKIEPFVEWIGGDECIAYYGIRADEEREGFNNKTSPNIIPSYPLQKVGFGIKHVYKIITDKGLKPPTFIWQSVYEEVCRILGVDVKGILQEWEFDILFAGRSRANCYFCFFQRIYELVWLLETHPQLFAKAESYEHMGGDKPYYWKNGYPMSFVRENAKAYKKKRVYEIIKTISPKFQYELFDDGLPEENYLDVLSVKSCGLFCGK